jgi:hypothetical protein
MTKFKPIPGFEGLYDVSDSGVVRSLSIRNKQANTPRIKELKQSDNGGYKRVTLQNNGEKRQLWVHRLVLLAFIGPPKDGEECAHLDGDPSNNHLSNLKWCHKRENEDHKLKHGTRPMGDTQGSSKLKPADIEEIFAMRKAGNSLRFIANKFNVSNQNINLILQGKAWKHVSQARGDWPIEEGK